MKQQTLDFADTMDEGQITEDITMEDIVDFPSFMVEALQKNRNEVGTPTHAVDCGTNTSTIWSEITQTSTVISHEEVLRLPETLPRGSFVVSEGAHLGTPRGDKSLSQPFTADELLSIYSRFEEAGITLRLFPQQSTPRVNGWANEQIKAGKLKVPDPSFLNDKGEIEKTDLTDPWCLTKFLHSHPLVVEALMKPREKFHTDDTPDPFRLEIYEYKSHCNYLCNKARRMFPKYSDKISMSIKNNIDYIYDNLDDTARDCFNLIKYKRNGKTPAGVPYKKGDINLNQAKIDKLFSILCTIMDEDGSIRIRPYEGKMAGWGYIKRHILCMTSFHFKGGVARSTLYHHGMKSWVSAMMNQTLGLSTSKKMVRGGMINTDSTKEGKKPFTPKQEETYLYFRKLYCNSIRSVWQLFRDMLNDRNSPFHSN